SARIANRTTKVTTSNSPETRGTHTAPRVTASLLGGAQAGAQLFVEATFPRRRLAEGRRERTHRPRLDQGVREQHAGVRERDVPRHRSPRPVHGEEGVLPAPVVPVHLLLGGAALRVPVPATGEEGLSQCLPRCVPPAEIVGEE